MSSELDAVLQQYRDSSKSEREKGTYFENLIQKFLVIDALNDADYRVEKMKFAKHNVDGKTVADKNSVIYNSKITMQNIPLAAYDYIVNGRPALEWVVERQAVTTDKKSGITNDANDWAIETMGNAKYPLELFQPVITVSLETMKIVDNLPKLELPTAIER